MEKVQKIPDVILYGSDDEEIKFHMMIIMKHIQLKSLLEYKQFRRYLETDSEWKREEISQYQSESNCEKCKGLRLKDEALCVKVNDLNISQITHKSIEEAKSWFEDLPKFLDAKQNKIAQHILKEINERLNFLLNVGLNYLTLQESGTLSGGEVKELDWYPNWTVLT